MGEKTKLIRGDKAFTYRELVAIARGEAQVALSAGTEARLVTGRRIVASAVSRLK